VAQYPLGSETSSESSQSPWRSRKTCPLSSTVPYRAYGLAVTTPRSIYASISSICSLFCFHAPKPMCYRSVPRPPLSVVFDMVGWGWLGVDYDVPPSPHDPPRPTTHQVTPAQPPPSIHHIHREAGGGADRHRLPSPVFIVSFPSFSFISLPLRSSCLRVALCVGCAVCDERQ